MGKMGYRVKENDILRIVKDFDIFIEYLVENKPLLTPKGALNPKACYELNSLLSYPEIGVNIKTFAVRYSQISFFFTIAVNIGLVLRSPIKGQKNIIEQSDSYNAFREMNTYSKYLVILLGWMRHTDFDENSREKLTSAFVTGLIDETFIQLSKMDKSEMINRQNKSMRKKPLRTRDSIRLMMNEYYPLLRHFNYLGIIKFDADDIEVENSYFTLVNKLHVTSFGIALSTALRKSPVSIVNKYSDFSQYEFDEDEDEDEDDDDDGVKEDDDAAAAADDTCDIDNGGDDFDYEESIWNILERIKLKPLGSKEFLEPFIPCFPENSIDSDMVNRVAFLESGEGQDKSDCVYEFKVSVMSGCYRYIQCSGDNTFHNLHMAIQNAFEFDNDHLYAFFPSGRKRRQNAIKHPYMDEPPFADLVYISEAGLYVNQEILYLFDFGDNWHFYVKLLSIKTRNPDQEYPFVSKSVGEPPNQYGDFESEWED